MIFQPDPTKQKDLPTVATSYLPSAGVLVAGKYRIEHLLDCGSMGAVFRAQHEEMHHAVALKCLLPRLAGVAEYRERFLREARTAAHVRHPNVVHIYDIGEHNGLPFMVMELLEGQPLDLALHSGMPTADALNLVTEAMRGVAAAHAHNIVHRDVKPGNIFVVAGGRPGHALAKILDFGISKWADGRSELHPITNRGETVGTPHYMSLEQLSGARDIDARSDIYAFGVILYELLTHTYPFHADTLASLAHEMASASAAPPSQLRADIPEVFDAIVLKALASDRADRYSSLEELIHAITPVVAQLDVHLRTGPKANSVLQPLQPLQPLQCDEEANTKPISAIYLVHATPRHALASIALTTGLLGVAVWLTLLLVLPRAASEQKTQVLAVAVPPPTAPLAQHVEEPLAPSVSAGPLEVSSLLVTPPTRPSKPPTGRRKRMAAPVAGKAVIAAPAEPKVAEGERSGTLRRDAL